MQITIAKADVSKSLRPGDRITAIDGRLRDRPLVVAAPANEKGAVRLDNEGTVTETYLYPDTHIAREITVDREPASAVTVIGRRSLARVVAGDRIIVARHPERGLMSTRRAKGVEVVRVLSNTPGGGWRCRTLVTTGGTIVAPSATVFGIVG